MDARYSVILGNLGNTRDRFCSSYKDNPDTIEMLKRASRIPHIKGIELVGTWDVTPDNAREMSKALTDLGLQCICIIPDLFADARFGKGSYCSMDAAVRQYAMDYTQRMCDAARELGCDLLDLWPGQDGFDYLGFSGVSQGSYAKKWETRTANAF